MTDIIRKIQDAQQDAAEQAVIDRLENEVNPFMTTTHTSAQLALDALNCAEDNLMRMSQPFNHGLPKTYDEWFGYRMKDHAVTLRFALQKLIEGEKGG
jgi:hypothetical protein